MYINNNKRPIEIESNQLIDMQIGLNHLMNAYLNGDDRAEGYHPHISALFHYINMMVSMVDWINDPGDQILNISIK